MTEGIRQNEGVERVTLELPGKRGVYDLPGLGETAVGYNRDEKGHLSVILVNQVLRGRRGWARHGVRVVSLSSKPGKERTGSLNLGSRIIDIKVTRPGHMVGN